MQNNNVKIKTDIKYRGIFYDQKSKLPEAG